MIIIYVDNNIIKYNIRRVSKRHRTFLIITTEIVLLSSNYLLLMYTLCYCPNQLCIVVH